MSVQITIRGVPETVRDILAARAARQHQSMQEFLRGELERLVSRPSVEEWLQGVRDRKDAAGTRVRSASIPHARDAARTWRESLMRAVSRLAPARPTPKTPLGRDRDVLQIHGDIMEPVDVEWDVMADPNRGGRL